MSKPVELLKQKTDNIEEKLETVVSRPLIPRADFIELKRLFALAFDTNGLVSHECQFIQNQNDQIDTSVIDATINKAVDVSSMFDGCSNLKSVDVSGWTFNYVLYAQEMFQNCLSLTSVDVSKWNTELLTKAFRMFMGCSSLTALDVSNWNTFSLEDAGKMFANCTNLSKLDVSKWTTKRLRLAQYIFSNCSSLTRLDMRSWDLSAAVKTNHMFEGCTSLRELIMTGATVKILASDNDRDFTSISYPAAASLNDNTVYKLTGVVGEYYFVVSVAIPMSE